MPEQRILSPHVIPEIFTVIKQGRNPFVTPMSPQSMEVACNLFDPKFDAMAFIRGYETPNAKSEFSKPERAVAVGIILALAAETAKARKQTDGKLRGAESQVDKLMEREDYLDALSVPSAVETEVVGEIDLAIRDIRSLPKGDALYVMHQNYGQLIRYTTSIVWPLLPRFMQAMMRRRLKPLSHIVSGMKTFTHTEEKLISLIRDLAQERGLTKGKFVEIFRNSGNISQTFSGKHVTPFTDMGDILSQNRDDINDFNVDCFTLQGDKVVFSQEGLRRIKIVMDTTDLSGKTTTRCPARSDIEDENYIERTHKRVADALAVKLHM